MIFLLDVNVLLGLADPASPFHPAAKSFFKRASAEGWATCPITENGFIRILGNPGFPSGPGNPQAARKIIHQWKSTPGHQFWTDDLSLCDDSYFPALLHSKHLTDCYLLALAAKRGGKFATFDRRIDPSWVAGGTAALVILETMDF